MPVPGRAFYWDCGSSSGSAWHSRGRAVIPNRRFFRYEKELMRTQLLGKCVAAHGASRGVSKGPVSGCGSILSLFRVVGRP